VAPCIKTKPVSVWIDFLTVLSRAPEQSRKGLARVDDEPPEIGKVHMSTNTAEQIVDGYLQQGLAISKLINNADATGLKQRLHMTAAVVQFGRHALSDQGVINAAFALAKSRDISIPKVEEGDNIFMLFLMLLRAEKKGDKWVLPTRGDERYAKIARHLYNVGVADQDVFRVLDKHEVISDGKGGQISATIVNIEKADKAIFGKPRTTKPLDKKVKVKAKAASAVGEFTLPTWAMDHFKASDGFGLAVYEVRGSKLRIIMDSGKEGRDVFNVIEKRIEDFEKIAPAKASANPIELKDVLASLTPKTQAEVEA